MHSNNNTEYFKLPSTPTRKLSPRWVGPFKVKRTVGRHKLAVELELPPVAKRMHLVFHVSALRPYQRSGNYQPPPLPDFVVGEPAWSVAFISDARYSGSRRQYRVHWEGQQDQDTWEPVRNLTNCAESIAAFWASKNLVNPDHQD